VSRRSTDLGVSWDGITVVYDQNQTEDCRLHKNATTCVWTGNPAPVAATGGPAGVTLFLLYSYKNSRARITTSTDLGKSFSKVHDLTTELKLGPGWFGTGPTAGVQLSSSGRLVVTAAMVEHDKRYKGKWLPGAATLYSDTNGSSWKAGPLARCMCGSPQSACVPCGSEPSVALLPAGHGLAMVSRRDECC
jgi:hypothetical protein